MRQAIVGLCLAIVVTGTAFGQEWKTAHDAWRAASVHLRVQNFEAAQAPLEAALVLTPQADKQERVQIYRALLNSYRLLPEIDKMLEAVEYILENSESRNERSLVSLNVSAFVHQRGKTAQATARYEERLKQNAKDPAALAILADIHSRLPAGDRPRGKVLKQQLAELDQQRAAAKAQRLAAEADKDPAAAASHWKDVARAWLEAEDKAKAREALDKSLKAPAEARSSVLTKFWHEGVGDVLLELGDRDQAVAQYEQALKFAPRGTEEALKTKITKAKAG